MHVGDCGLEAHGQLVTVVSVGQVSDEKAKQRYEEVTTRRSDRVRYDSALDIDS